ncbi:hypothetical protein GIB67_040380 [Kingdonia uniflora]|uniref:Uncharacterized protein n=1 Tax=Kingdonia uniflora TaxID=39325 RepID=A0A7J7KXF4_9MAGN|nr:hypothetical protein GIB67_040380 [Kingdonia uniflora]
MEPASSPRISFSVDFFKDDKEFISISPNYVKIQTALEKPSNVADFEFSFSGSNTMLPADELFYEGKLLPFWQIQHSAKLNKVRPKPKLEETQQQPQQKKAITRDDQAEESSRLVTMLEDCMIMFNYRETNGAADNLARMHPGLL